MRRYDVVILGGGPAGAAAALSLKQLDGALSVAIVERSGYDNPRIGETLTPAAQPLLVHLGVWDAFLEASFLPAYGTCAAWGGEELHANEYIYSPGGRGWHLDRRAFDALLATAAAGRGVALFTHAALAEQRRLDDGLWRLALRTREVERIELEARFVVDATGRQGIFARRQGARRVVLDRLAGIFMFFDLDEPSEDASTLVEAWEEGWWYSAVLPASRLVVALMTDADLARRRGLQQAESWLAQVEQTRHTRRRLASARPSAPPAAHAAYSHHLDRLAGDGWLAVGDAAATVDPLSSQGIFKALRGGIFASYAIVDLFRGQPQGLAKYASLAGEEFAAYLDSRADYYSRERRWPGSPFWRRRQTVDAGGVVSRVDG